MSKDAGKLREVGENVLVRVEGDVLHLAINLKRRGAVSKSGKSIIVGSTRGVIRTPGDSGVSYSLNAFVSNEGGAAPAPVAAAA